MNKWKTPINVNVFFTRETLRIPGFLLSGKNMRKIPEKHGTTERMFLCYTIDAAAEHTFLPEGG